MSKKDKKHLIDKLVDNHLETQAIMENVDLQSPVYKDSGWRVKDIIGHISAWNQEAAQSLRTHRSGSEYLIPNLDDTEVEYNARAVHQRREMSGQQILTEWQQSSGELKQAIQDMPINMFPGDMLYPWGEERGTIAKLIEFMIEHSVEHRVEIENAVSLSSET